MVLLRILLHWTLNSHTLPHTPMSLTNCATAELATLLCMTAWKNNIQEKNKKSMSCWVTIKIPTVTSQSNIFEKIQEGALNRIHWSISISWHTQNKPNTRTPEILVKKKNPVDKDKYTEEKKNLYSLTVPSSRFPRVPLTPWIMWPILFQPLLPQPPSLHLVFAL